ncbi:hypothetical protein [Aquipseudomonas alcaligenes]|uniref:Uncharacterized protein n=1 Tax=Aquipseudomonas alcaligenes (strain ATCC 14909 / DSM 50342 / CCUG 1425 / JCM 20561 / NBRC 14159 / NCIMB 9945 / NCTC 10367 / 1577) TaxID=1215092 RepID=U3BDC0_AQUA1|nr:hypothetical protein [Pseudomonas alcaligenes]SUD16186.1 Uncharacterised protein [Pseudomonas alcaligenes]SUD16206.1 Uncharacterised protein [Pseudomonas alcaligenes]SUD16232.1 Uncharacterised protein [Pseudomonas alcaligenes]SUD16259.1 Uncharacterised protein [Pseudomonas alcaligenes]GAD64753.1 hypothetical protein PA6_046_00370 [Pseudomonas alcaligenes NBRC 14159]
MQAANDDSHASDQPLEVVLHARYLLALKNHRRDGLVLGFFYGVLTTGCAWYLVPKVLALLARL